MASWSWPPRPGTRVLSLLLAQSLAKPAEPPRGTPAADKAEAPQLDPAALAHYRQGIALAQQNKIPESIEEVPPSRTPVAQRGQFP